MNNGKPTGGFSVGEMRHRITIMEPVETQDDTGQPIVTWANFGVDEPAKFTPTSGVETMRGRQLVANTKGIFVVRFREGYTDKMRITHEGSTYGITFINNIDGLRKFIELFVSSA